MENASASSPIVNPHFFKPLLPGFHNHLDIPTTFFSKHIVATTNEGNTTVKLRSDASDLTWEVKMNGRRLTQGWENFSTSHNLRVGDIVVFRHEGALLFHVTCFGPSCCEIQYEDDVIELSSDSDSEMNQKTEEGGTSSDHSCLVTRVTASNLSKDILFLPIDFARANGLMYHRRCKIILLNEDEKPWRLIMDHDKTRGRVYITAGWRSFCYSNQQRVHDELTFKLVRNGSTPVLKLCSCPSSPFLTLTLTPSNLKTYNLFIPATFVRANSIENARKITLVDRYGIKRTTSLKPAGVNGRMRVGKEWREFCQVNGVEIGESFKLELIKEEEDTATHHLLKFCSKVL